MAWYIKNGGAKKGYIVETNEGWHLIEAERRRILLNNIYGVDIDAQAVEVTKLSLQLKLLEDANAEAIKLHFKLSHEPALPDLDANVRCGNSLIGVDFYSMKETSTLDDIMRHHINAFDWKKAFPQIMSSGNAGFHAVIGNPPYVLLQSERKERLQGEYFRSHYSASFKVDLYHLFIEKVISLTRPGGICALITPSNYLTNNYMASLRRVMLEKGGLETLVVIDGKVFLRRSVDTSIFIARKPEAEIKGRKIKLIHVKAAPGFPEISKLELSVDHILGSEEALFTGGNRSVTALWNKLENTCQSLDSIAYVNFGKQLRDRKTHPRDIIKIDNAIPRGYAACYAGDNIERYALHWGHLACLDEVSPQPGGCWNPQRQNAMNKILTRQIGFWPEYAIDKDGYECLNTIFMGVATFQRGG